MKTVLITGGSRGIGKAIVEYFSKNGYSVAFTYKSSDNEAKNLAESTGAVAIKADSLYEEQVVNAVKTAENALGKIDCLINNAGVSSFSLFTDLSLEDWNNTLGVSLTGAFLYSRAVVPGMVSRKCGRIINITSIWGIVGSSCEVHYSASKSGLIGMTKALAKEVGLSGITVNSVSPGVILTDMTSHFDEETMNALKEETPLNKIGTPEDVAGAVSFLASKDADFITGQNISVNGGMNI